MISHICIDILLLPHTPNLLGPSQNMATRFITWEPTVVILGSQ